MTIRYSICITCHNEARNIRESLKSILDQIDERFEVVIVDGNSTDGTFEILKEFSTQTRIKIFQRKCSRGTGRQIAFESSSGDYVISNMDLDDVFKPVLPALIKFYLEHAEGRVLLAVASNGGAVATTQAVTVSPRRLLTSLGGWRDLQWGEDQDLWSRAAKIDKYSWTFFNMHEKTNPHIERKKMLGKMRLRYVTYRELLRTGRKVLSGEHANLSQRLIYILARLSLPFYKSYKDEFNATFNPYSPSFFIGAPAEESLKEGEPLTRKS